MSARTARRVALLVCGLLCVGSLACISGLAAEGLPEGHSIRIVGWTAPDRLDPHVTWVAAAKIITSSIAEGLVDFVGSTLSVEPQLAESWDVSADGKIYTFHLRHGVKFTDGSDLNAEAVSFNFQRLRAIALGPVRFFTYVEECRVVDEYTIEFKNSASRAAFLVCLPFFRIISPQSVKGHATEADPWARNWVDKNPVGTGPYVMAEWQAGQYVRVVRNDAYWGGWKANQVKEAYLLEVAETTTARMMLERGDADIDFLMEEADIPALRANPEIGILNFKLLSTFMLELNTSSGPLSNPLVRQAVAHAFDFQKYNDMSFGLCTSMRTPFPAELVCDGEITSNIATYPFDLDAARRLIAEAGYTPDQLKFTIGIITGFADHRRLALVLQDGLGQIGVSLEIREMPWAGLLPLMQKQETALNMVPFYASAADGTASSIGRLVFHSDSIGNRNFMFLRNEAVDQLIEDAEAAIDAAELCGTVTLLSKVLMEEVPAIPINQTLALSAHRTGMTYYPLGTVKAEMRLYSVRVER